MTLPTRPSPLGPIGEGLVQHEHRDGYNGECIFNLHYNLLDDNFACGEVYAFDAAGQPFFELGRALGHWFCLPNGPVAFSPRRV